MLVCGSADRSLYSIKMPPTSDKITAFVGKGVCVWGGQMERHSSSMGCKVTCSVGHPVPPFRLQ